MLGFGGGLTGAISGFEVLGSIHFGMRDRYILGSGFWSFEVFTSVLGVLCLDSSEPFINGQAVKYEPKYHWKWMMEYDPSFKRYEINERRRQNMHKSPPPGGNMPPGSNIPPGGNVPQGGNMLSRGGNMPPGGNVPQGGNMSSRGGNMPPNNFNRMLPIMGGVPQGNTGGMPQGNYGCVPSNNNGGNSIRHPNNAGWSSKTHRNMQQNNQSANSQFHNSYGNENIGGAPQGNTGGMPQGNRGWMPPNN